MIVGLDFLARLLNYELPILEKKGKIIDDADLFIAASALDKNMVLVTNNTKHFNRINGLRLENWSKI